MNVIVEGGAVPSLVKHLQAPPSSDDDRDQRPFEHEVEKGSAFALGLLAVKVSFIVLHLPISFIILQVFNYFVMFPRNEVLSIFMY